MELPRFRGRCTAFALRDDWVPLFITDRRQVVQAGMPAVRVVPALDEVEDGHAGLSLGRETAIQQLALEGGEKALTEGVVIGVAHAPHGRADTGLAAAKPKGDRGVLAALVGVMDHGGWPPLRHGHVQRVEDELGSEVCRHRPPDHAPTPRICKALNAVGREDQVQVKRAVLKLDKILPSTDFICL